MKVFRIFHHVNDSSRIHFYLGFRDDLGAIGKEQEQKGTETVLVGSPTVSTGKDLLGTSSSIFPIFVLRSIGFRSPGLIPETFCGTGLCIPLARHLQVVRGMFTE